MARRFSPLRRSAHRELRLRAALVVAMVAACARAPTAGAWVPSEVLERSSGCTLEPLQVLGPGHYVSLGEHRRNFSSCAEFTGGACPFTVPFPELPCMVNCVAEEADCVRFNKHTPGVNPRADKFVCVQCPVTACEECAHGAGGVATCRKCFDGFTGSGGEGGEWEECVLWDQDIIKVITLVFSAVLGLLSFLVLVGTSVGACSRLKKRMVPSRGAQPLLDLDEERNILHPANYKLNCEAIQLGLSFSVMSSIKLSSLGKLRRQLVGVRSALWTNIRLLFNATVNDAVHLDDLGIGLFLFFNTQKFLVAVAFVTWMVARSHASLEDPSARFAAAIGRGHCPAEPMDVVMRLYGDSPQLEYARSNRTAVLVLWLVLLLMSWGFYYLQHRFVHEYDRKTHSAEDYTLRLEGVPPHVTSERRLMALLETEFRMQGRIHGVSICYNVLALPPETRASLEEMIECIIEEDTFANGWCEASVVSANLQDRLAKQREEFAELVASGQLVGSGEAYVVFKKQEDMIKVQDERCGIILGQFDDINKVAVASLSMRRREGLNGDSSTSPSAPTASTPVAHSKSMLRHSVNFVNLSATQSEPAGVRFWNFAEEEAVSRFNNTVKMPLRMLCYIGLYSIVSQLFYMYMIRPWQDNMLDGAESSGAVKLTGKIVILFNFAIQTMVMVDVENYGNFKYLSDIDQRTFLWNTLLLVITNMYLIMQECYHVGMRWDMTPPPGDAGSQAWWDWYRMWFQATQLEGVIAERLVGLMTEQILMLYVLGEVANVLGPVMFYWIALRAIFVWNLGGDNSRIQKLLRAMLPEHRDGERSVRVTARLAERAQILVPLLLWMEYTYIVIFSWMAFCTFFLATKEGSTVCGLLFGFSVIFYIWQRHVMLWLYGKATYDAQDSYVAFTHVWGFVLGFLPPIGVWWMYRMGDIQERGFALVVMVMVFALATLIYQYGIFLIDWKLSAFKEGVDSFEGEDGFKDPGYFKVMNGHHYSWWNMNPIYVLKSRHCCDEWGYEVHTDDVQQTLWPKAQPRRGFFELGKEFRHEERSLWFARQEGSSPSCRGFLQTPL